MSQSVSSLNSGPRELTRAGKVVYSGLTRFAQRQSRLYGVRGACVGLASLLGMACGIVALDATPWLQDSLRWCATCIMYGVATVVAWRFGWSQSLRRNDHQNSAMGLEQAHPTFRESLLSLVELQQVESPKANHSPLFLKAIERSVAHEMERLNVDELLPWRLIANAVKLAGGAIGLVALLSILPYVRFPERLMRALIPFVDLERPSRIRIDVVSPSVPRMLVPSDQVVEFEMRTSGMDVSQASLEIVGDLRSSDRAQPTTQRSNPSLQTLPMRLGSSSGEFSATAAVGTEPIRYRFRAGDGVSPFRTIIPVARPRVEQFYVTIDFPEYADQTPVVVIGPRGDFQALSGSDAHLAIDVNQAMESAVLLYEYTDTGEKQEVSMAKQRADSQRALASDSMERYSVDLHIDRDARYQIKLKSKTLYRGVPIENTFSPFYQIDAIEDQPPQIVWGADDETLWKAVPKPNQTFLVSPEEILHLVAHVNDDLPIVSLDQEFSVNRGEWKSISPTLEFAPAIPDGTDNRSSMTAMGLARKSNLPGVPWFEGKSTWRWDLLEHAASSGDSIATRVVARDRKGQLAYSPVLQFSLTSSGFEQDRHRHLMLRSQLVEPLQSLSDTFDRNRDKLWEQLNRLRDAQLPREQVNGTLSELRKVAEDTIKKSAEVRKLAEKLVAELPFYPDQVEFEYVVRVTSKIEREMAGTVYALSQPDLFPAPPIDQPPVVWDQQQREQRLNRLLGAYSQGSDHARRMIEVYRQFIGLEAMTSLTKDLTFLMEYQASQIQRSATPDFEMLSRSQQVSELYFQSVIELAEKISPSVHQGLRDRFNELYRWIDQTQTEIRDIVQGEANETTALQLKQRIERSYNELKTYRWAYNLDGGLMWSNGDARRDLLQRAGSVWPVLNQVFEQMQRLSEVSKDPTIDSKTLTTRRMMLLDELAGPIANAAIQMVDRRDLHQRRPISDNLFASDMGMAHRAWTGTLEKWSNADVDAASIVEDLRQIAWAYRVLEAAHEMVDPRLGTESLRNLEQYRWRTLDAQLNHWRQWDCLTRQLEFGHIWVRESGYTDGVADKFNNLRWMPPFNEVSQRLFARRDANHTNPTSASNELDTGLKVWKAVELAAQPTIEKARAILAKHSPSISELAKKAAEQTNQLVEKTKPLAPERDVPNPRQNPKANPSKDSPSKETKTEAPEPQEMASLKQLEEQRAKTEDKTTQLQDALIELANKQNILKTEELEAAKDSDKALRLIEAVTTAMDQAIDEAIEKVVEPPEANRSKGENHQSKLDPAESQQQRREALQNAITKEKEAAQAIDLVARHFEAIERSANDPSEAASKALAESKRALAEQAAAAERAQSQQPDARPSDLQEQLTRAEQLAELANSDPETLLKKLEAELKRNQLMQAELSDISKSTLANAVAELKNAANKEKNLANQLENADIELNKQKQLSADQLRAAADQADRMAATLMLKGSYAAQRANSEAKLPPLESAAQELRNAANLARYLPAEAPVEEMRNVAENLVKKGEQAKQVAEQNKQTIEQAIEKLNAKDEPQRIGARDEMQRWQSQTREEVLNLARENAQRRRDRAQQAQQQAQGRHLELNDANQAREQARQNAERNPNDVGANDSLQRNTLSVQLATARKQAADEIATQAETLAKEATELQQSMENAPRANLDRPNPQAALASEQLAKAVEQLNQMEQRLQPTLQHAQKPIDPKVASNNLENGRQQQQNVQSTVQQTAEDVARSARHESRLQNPLAAAMLDNQVKNIEGAAQGTLETAKQQLKEAASNARSAEQEQSKSTENPPAQQSLPSAGQPIQSVKQGTAELNQLASDLEGKLAESNSGSPQSQSGQGKESSPKPSTGRRPNSNEPSSGEGKAAADMARLLNDLDEQLNGKPSGDGDSSKDSSSKGDPSQDRSNSNGPPSIPDSLKESAQQLSSAMSQERLAQKESMSDKRSQSKSANKSKRPGRGSQPARDTAPGDRGGLFLLPPGATELGKDWGKLRNQRAEDVVEGSRDEFDPEYRDAIQAYYRSLAKPK